VILIAQISHTLAGHVTWSGVRDFVVLFVLIWFGWLNGTLYHELHGGEDGRSRTYIFVQMSVLAFLAVYAGHAADTPSDGRGFAVVYTGLLAVLAWQWFDVRRHDAIEMRPLATRYLFGLAVVVALSVATIFVSHDLRLTLWWVMAVAVLLVGAVSGLQNDPKAEDAFHVTESMAERFGLFTIIVLGEVVVGVVDGVAESEARSFINMAVALSALGIGIGIWWNYFDFIGRREPRAGHAARGAWVYGHLLVAVAIAATGAGMVSLIEHASDARTPQATAWLVGGGLAVVAIAIAMLSSTMPYHPGRRRVVPVLVGSAVVMVAIAAIRPSPWLLSLGLYVSLFVVWVDAFVLHSRHGEPIATT